MEANSILHADLLDILFEGRNKEYGAYALRKTYNKRIVHAIAITVLGCLLLFVLSLFAGSKKSTAISLIVKSEINLSKVDEQREVIKRPPVTHRVQQVATRRVTIPRIVPNNEVKPEDTPPPNDELDNIKIGTKDIPGVDGEIVGPPLEQTTASNIKLPANEPDYTKEFRTVQIEAQFPGGMDAWTKYLQRNLKTEVPVDNGAPEGSYTVVVSFLVDRDGNISEVQALNDPGYGTADEAVRVIKKSRQWIPALQNGNHVIYHQKQSITFIVQGQ